MKRELYYEVSTMGDFCGGSEKARPAKEVRPVPDRCWRKFCEDKKGAGRRTMPASPTDENDCLPLEVVGRREAAKAEIVWRRTYGESEASVAKVMGISPRQVRRHCQGVEGIKRGDGNRHRHE